MAERKEVLVQERAALSNEFYAAADDALFRQETVAAVLKKSLSWCESARWRGDGPKWRRVGRNALYSKGAVLRWLEQFAERDRTAAIVTSETDGSSAEDKA